MCRAWSAVIPPAVSGRLAGSPAREKFVHAPAVAPHGLALLVKLLNLVQVDASKLLQQSTPLVIVQLVPPGQHMLLAMLSQALAEVVGDTAS